MGSANETIPLVASCAQVVKGRRERERKERQKVGRNNLSRDRSSIRLFSEENLSSNNNKKKFREE